MHFLPIAQGSHLVPPQSTSLSSPFFLASEQVVRTSQAPLKQAVPAGQDKVRVSQELGLPHPLSIIWVVLKHRSEVGVGRVSVQLPLMDTSKPLSVSKQLTGPEPHRPKRSSLGVRSSRLQLSGFPHRRDCVPVGLQGEKNKQLKSQRVWLPVPFPWPPMLNPVIEKVTIWF